MKRKPEPLFNTEAELCAAFIAWASKDWICYAETCGWDILLVDRKTGHQMGVQAKLSLNAKVIAQAVPSAWDNYHADTGPDYRALLVPDRSGLNEFAQLIGLAVWCPDHLGSFHQSRGAPVRFELAGNVYSHGGAMMDWNPCQRHALPEYINDPMHAGTSAPIQLTPWKIGALKVLAEIEVNGSISRKGISDCGVDPRRWVSADGWLGPVGQGQFTRGKVPAFDAQHPDVYAEIVAKTARRILAA
jgi:hypothetical protein